MSKETRIQKAENEIEFCNNEINELNGFTEICPHCNGEGRFMTVHRTFSHHSYTSCYICGGKGKVTKETLEIYNKI